MPKSSGEGPTNSTTSKPPRKRHVNTATPAEGTGGAPPTSSAGICEADATGNATPSMPRLPSTTTVIHSASPDAPGPTADSHRISRRPSPSAAEREDPAACERTQSSTATAPSGDELVGQTLPANTQSSPPPWGDDSTDEDESPYPRRRSGVGAHGTTTTPAERGSPMDACVVPLLGGGIKSAESTDSTDLRVPQKRNNATLTRNHHQTRHTLEDEPTTLGALLQSALCFGENRGANDCFDQAWHAANGSDATRKLCKSYRHKMGFKVGTFTTSEMMVAAADKERIGIAIVDPASNKIMYYPDEFRTVPSYRGAVMVLQSPMHVEALALEGGVPGTYTAAELDAWLKSHTLPTEPLPTWALVEHNRGLNLGAPPVADNAEGDTLASPTTYRSEIAESGLGPASARPVRSVFVNAGDGTPTPTWHSTPAYRSLGGRPFIASQEKLVFVASQEKLVNIGLAKAEDQSEKLLFRARSVAQELADCTDNALSADGLEDKLRLNADRKALV